MGDLPSTRRRGQTLVGRYRCDRLSVRTTPESSLNYAFFGEDGFTVECWPLDERTDVLTDLVLHQVTVNGDIDGD